MSLSLAPRLRLVVTELLITNEEFHISYVASLAIHYVHS